MTSSLRKCGLVLAFVLVGCGKPAGPDGVIHGSGSAVVYTFGGPSALSASEKSCLAARPQIAAVVRRFAADATEFQRAIFEGKDLVLAQQSLDCFGDRWSRTAVSGVDEKTATCQRAAFQDVLQETIDAGSTELRLTASDTTGAGKVVARCRG